eukprot:116579-Pelagomonas_calceolata.AAC.2
MGPKYKPVDSSQAQDSGYVVLATNDIPAVNIANVPVEDNMTYLPQFRYCRSFENPNILVPVW